MSLQVKFLPNIELGHLLQAVIMLAALSGWALWGYANIETQIAGLHSEVQLQRQRVDTDEAAAKQDRDDQRGRDAKVAASLDKIADELGDIRVTVATGKADGAHR